MPDQVGYFGIFVGSLYLAPDNPPLVGGYVALLESRATRCSGSHGGTGRIASIPPESRYRECGKPQGFAQLKYRPVDDWRAKIVNATHTFWWVKSDTGDWILSGGNAGGYLGAWPSKGDYSPTSHDNKDQPSGWASSVSNDVCSRVDAMVSATQSFPKRYLPYDSTGFSGPNSNSFAHYLANVGMFNIPIQPLGSVGLWFPISSHKKGRYL